MGGQMLEVVMSGRSSHPIALLLSDVSPERAHGFFFNLSFELPNIPVVILTSVCSEIPPRYFFFKNANHRAARLNCSGVESGNLWSYSSISLLKLAPKCEIEEFKN